MKFLGLTLAVLLISGFVAIEARSVEKRSVFSDLLTNAKEAFNNAKTQIGKFFTSAISEQIKKARESFVKGLEQLQTAADDVIDDSVDALQKYLPGLQGIVEERVDAVSAALDKYVESNKGKLDEVRQLLLENAQKALTNLKNRLDGIDTTAAVNEVVASVDNIENQVVSEVTAAKSRSIFKINWTGLKQTMQERISGMKNKFDKMIGGIKSNISQKIQEQKNKCESAWNKIHAADKLPAPQKIEAVKEAAAVLDQADNVVASVASEVEVATSASA